ncbi:MAG: hypothetical protein WD077_03895 [Bacteroidia bacterium]
MQPTNYRRVFPRLALMAFLFLSLFTFSGCDLIVGIFEAGFWTAIILVVIIVLIVGWIIYKMRK